MCEADISIYRLPPSWKSLSVVLVWIAIEFLAPADSSGRDAVPSAQRWRAPPVTLLGRRELGPSSLRQGGWVWDAFWGIGAFFPTLGHPRLAQWLKVWELGGVSGSPVKAWVGGSAGFLGCPSAPCGGFEGCAQPLRAVSHSPGPASLGGFSLKLYFYSCWCF